jgi:glycosyltransferase involved in cell wall biosynthesis
MKKNIINITIAPDTFEIYLIDIIEYLETHNYDTYTMANEQETLDFEYNLKNKKNFFTHKISRKLVFFRELKYLFEVYKFFRKNKFDIIHLHTPKILLLFSIIIKLTNNGKVVGTYHGTLAKKGKYIRNFIFHSLDFLNSFFIDYMFTVNKNDLERFRKFKLYNHNNSSVISLSGIGVKSKLFKIISEKEKNQLKEKLGIKLGSLVIGNVSRFTKDKGIDVIIKVIEELQDKYDLNIIFLHVGSIEDIDYYNNIKIKNMISLGFKKQEDLYLYYNLMDLFVFPSLREGFGLSVAEANLCGVPALVSNIKGLNEVVETGKNGFKIDHFKQYIEYINYYYLNKEELNNLKENTIEYAQKRFNQIDSALNTYHVYENLLKRKA